MSEMRNLIVYSFTMIWISNFQIIVTTTDRVEMGSS